MTYEGNVYRPPSEAKSLLIQTTIGCAWNKCTFCDMYAGEKFRVRNMDEIKADLLECTVHQNRYKRIFLCDGDALVLSGDKLIEILSFIKQHYKNLEAVRAYASARDILAKTDEELAKMKALGLDMVYIGLESGSDKVLKDINKGISRQEMIKAAGMLKKAGIKQSISIIAGLGGPDGWQEHITQTAKALNEMQPEFLGLLVLMPRSDANVYVARQSKAYVPEEIDILNEMRLLVKLLELDNCLFTSAHVSNYIHVGGNLPNDKAALLATIDKLIARNTVSKQK